jgi:hypothetical protein
MEEKIDNIIPKLIGEMASDTENESQELLDYYVGCNQEQRTAVNEVTTYLCGWSFETLLEKCGIAVGEDGEPVLG